MADATPPGDRPTPPPRAERAGPQLYSLIRVHGENPEAWDATNAVFLERLAAELAAFGPPPGAAAGPGPGVPPALLAHQKDKLAQPGPENAAEAEIIRHYEELADAREANARAHALEIENWRKLLSLRLSIAEAVVDGKAGDAAVLFCTSAAELRRVLESAGPAAASRAADKLSSADRAVIVDTYTESDLRITLQDRMKVELDEVVTAGPFARRVADLVAWAERHGRLLELVAALAADRPKRPDVQALLARLGGIAAAPAPKS